MQIEVFKNGESVGIYTVSENENWTCRWTAVDDGSEWTVVEHISGLKYDITVSKYGNVFTIVNHYSEESQPSKTEEHSKNPDKSDTSEPSKTPGKHDYSKPIQTGGSLEIVYYIVFIGTFSGILSIILLSAGRKNDRKLQ